MDDKDETTMDLPNNNNRSLSPTEIKIESKTKQRINAACFPTANGSER